MNPKTLRNLIFPLHRYLGLVVGTLLCIAGLTGSVLVFWHDIDRIVLTQWFGQIIPTGKPVSIAANDFVAILGIAKDEGRVGVKRQVLCRQPQASDETNRNSP